MTLTHRITYNTFIQFVGKIVFFISILLILSMLTRSLGEKGYGAYATIFTWMTILSIISDMGFYLTGVRELSRSGVDEVEIIGNLLSLKMISSFGVVAIAVFVLSFMPYDRVVRIGIRISMISLFLKSVSDSFKSIFQVRLQMQYAAMGEAAGSMLTLVATFVVLKAGYGLIGVIIAMISGSLLNLWLSALFARRFLTVWWKFDPRVMSALVRGALPLGLSGIMAVVYFNLDLLMLSWMKSMADVGVYGAAYKIVEMSSIVPALFLGTIFPLLTQAIGAREGRLTPLYNQAFFFIANISVPILCGGLVLADPLMRLITGERFGVSSTFDFPVLGMLEFGTVTLTFRVLLFAMVLMFLGQLNGYLIIAANRQIKLLRIYFILVPASIILNLFLIPRFSYIGAAAATLLTEVLAIVYTTWIVARELQQHPRLGIMMRALLASIPMTIIVCLFELHVVVLIGIGAVSYVLMLYLLGGFRNIGLLSQEEIL